MCYYKRSILFLYQYSKNLLESSAFQKISCSHHIAIYSAQSVQKENYEDPSTGIRKQRATILSLEKIHHTPYRHLANPPSFL